jgi:hypothetical protein
MELRSTMGDVVDSDATAPTFDATVATKTNAARMPLSAPH